MSSKSDLLGLVDSIANPDLTGETLSVSVEFLTAHLDTIETEAAERERARIIAALRAHEPPWLWLCEEFSCEEKMVRFLDGRGWF